MLDRFLRRLNVGRRIVGGFLVLVALLMLTAPMTAANLLFLVGRLEQVSNIEASTDRKLLQASVRIQASRVNLLRYMQDYVPTTQEAQDDIYRASQLLLDAQNLVTAPEQKQAIAAVLAELGDYRTNMINVESARRQGDSQQTSRLLYAVSATGNDLEQRIDQIVQDSQARIAAANEATLAEARRGQILLILGYAIILALSLVIANLITRSITRPVAELRSGAEALREGRLDTTIPAGGADELGLLARAFNDMAGRLSQSYLEMEQRVQDRTREAERRSRYLQASAQVGRSAASILDAEQLIRQAVELIREQFDLYYVGLFLVDPAGEWAVLRAGTGQAGQRMLERGHKIKVGEGMIGWSVAHAQARVALQAGADAVRLATDELPDTRSEAALPLRSRGQVIGALTVQSAQPDAFDETALAALEIMADQVAIALDNARLFAESQAALETAQRAYSQISQQAWMHMARARPLDYVCTARGIYPPQGDWTPVMAQAQATSQTAYAGGPNVAAPVKIRNETVGVIEFRKPGGALAWSPQEIKLIEALTQQLGEALESARLYQDTQRRAAQEKIVGEATARMRESLDVDKVLQAAARELRRALGLHDVTIRMGKQE